MQFLSPSWIAALDRAARERDVADDDPLADVTLSVEQVITDGPSYRLVVDHGALSVTGQDPGDDDPTNDADLRLSCDRATAAAIAQGQRPALDAFIEGDLRLGGDTTLLLAHREALEALGDLYASVKAATVF